MEDRSNPFKKVGLVLLVLGVVDIGFMAYCIAKGISYSSSFNIFAVVAGILLLRSGVATARVVRWFSVFLAVAFAGLLIVVPLSTPFDLLVAQISLNTLSSVGSFAVGLAVIAILIWIHRQLSTEEALERLSEAGYKTGKPKSAYIAGCLLLILAAGLSIGFLNGGTAQKAEAIAQEQYGSDFRYHVSSMSVSGSSGTAWVVAYKNDEIRTVQVEW